MTYYYGPNEPLDAVEGDVWVKEPRGEDTIEWVKMGVAPRWVPIALLVVGVLGVVACLIFVGHP